MELIISSKEKLTKKYGDNFLRIDNKLREYAKVINGELCYIEDNKIENKPESIRDFINSKGNNLSVLIVGGDNIIPFYATQNPVNNLDDYDTIVYTDNFYASTDEDILIPERPVGRIPDDGNNPNFLITIFDNLLTYRGIAIKKPKGFMEILIEMILRILGKKNTEDNITEESYKTNGSFGYSAKVWKLASEKVYKTICSQTNTEIETSPPIKSNSLDKNKLNKKKYHYFNLHGSEDTPNWYGQEKDNFPVAITPANLNNLEIKGTLVFSEACYGAKISNSIDNSMALKFLNEGCIGFCGSTKIAYGNSEDPADADVLGQYFLSNIIQGMTIGEALMKAKQKFATTQYLDPTAKKTLLEFVLYGDPELIIK